MARGRPKKNNGTNEVEVEEVSGEESNPLVEKRNKLISELREKLLTKQQMRDGGPGVRNRSINEAGYQANIDEINGLGKELGLPPVGMGDIRK